MSQAVPCLKAADLADQAPAASSTTVSSVLVGEGFAHGSRSRRGERLHQVFEDRCDWVAAQGRAGQLAVDAGDVVLSFEQVDARANQLARYLLARGARAGDRIALLFDEAVHSYVGMLAVLKINAAYVPLDVGFPPERVSYIVGDAGVRMVLSLSSVRARVPGLEDLGLEDLGAELVFVDEVADLIAQHDVRRLSDAERGDPVDELAYIIYTSGSTGRPKGVAINHSSICNFVRVAAEVYGIESRDRVYQGMTIAFDFSVEEIWVPWAAGATLVPKPAGASLLGMDLHEFLTRRRVTAMCCVPTLLATVEEDLPALRFLLVSGEACPRDLIARWHKSGRRFLNVYGPTEATVTATWTVVDPERPVTIGVPLPTYSTVILDPQDPLKALPAGEVGEIGIAGIGLASGYVNRSDLTDRAFIPDFLGMPGNPSGRIYRTGDLGRVNDDGEIEYQGRIDTQVKIRGYRIELTEIESVLLRVPGIAQAVVDTYEPEPGVVELVGYYSLRTDTTSVNHDQMYTQLRGRLPAYMVPAYLERLDVIPMTTNDKADRKALPTPTARRGVAPAGEHIAPVTDTERILADTLARTLGVDQVSVESHFFDDLGANSLLMAQFSAKVRRHPCPPPVSIKDVYLHPTIRSLAAALSISDPGISDPGVPELAPAQSAISQPVVRASTARYVRCGVLQLLLFLAFAYVSSLVLDRGFAWASDGAGPADVFGRATAFSAVAFLGACLLPILAKWLLVGRWKNREIPLWSLDYVRFWTVKSLIRSNPMVLFVGSPLYSLYLRALGARIGRGVTILSRTVPVATDLITIGDGAVIRRDCSFTGYRAVAGVLQTGPVTLGRDVFVGEKTVLDIDTAMGDGAQLGHTSSLHSGQAVPEGQRWHGSPAQPTAVEYRSVAPARCGAPLRFAYGLLLLLSAVLAVPVGLAVVVTLLTEVPEFIDVVGAGHPALSTASYYLGVLVFSLVLFLGFILSGLVLTVIVPRALASFIRPGRVYPLYGFHYAVQQAITFLANSTFFMTLFGDSSAAVHYLRSIGYNLSRVEQTGSNFGTELKQDSPHLSTVGSGTMVSDALSIMNADFSSTSFRMSRVSIGERNFLGNNIAFPASAKVGANCLLGTKVMVPIEGPVRENVGLLGSPCFEIPRTVARDTEFDYLKAPGELRRRLSAKNRHNALSMATFLFIRWVQFFAATLAVDLDYRFGELAITAALVLTIVFTVVFSALVERTVMGFRPLTPRFCSIYDPYFWRHERLWKLGAPALFSGTPFKNVIWRLLGVRIGHRVFDDGCAIPEKTLVTIGDDAVLNAGSVIQCHSLEDGSFKSDYTTIGAGATIGVEAFVHYGVTMGEGSVLDADAFLMKGEEIPPHTRWQGNPATQIRTIAPAAILLTPSAHCVHGHND
ncbi:MAG: Pls/PosA family non-ribosomal peptide synthetase [Pseudonocardiaceae bacterium]